LKSSIAISNIAIFPNELDTEKLPAVYGVVFYWQRWRIEDAYAIVKRLLGLAYF
jgi:hypothetical protein